MGISCSSVGAPPLKTPNAWILTMGGCNELPALMLTRHLISVEQCVFLVCIHCVMKVKSDKLHCTNVCMNSKWVPHPFWSSVALVVCEKLPKSSTSMPPYSPQHPVFEQPYNFVVSLHGCNAICHSCSAPL